MRTSTVKLRQTRYTISTKRKKLMNIVTPKTSIVIMERGFALEGDSGEDYQDKAERATVKSTRLSNYSVVRLRTFCTCKRSRTQKIDWLGRLSKLHARPSAGFSDSIIKNSAYALQFCNWRLLFCSHWLSIPCGYCQCWYISPLFQNVLYPRESWYSYEWESLSFSRWDRIHQTVVTTLLLSSG